MSRIRSEKSECSWSKVMVVRLLLVWCFRGLSTKSFPTKPTFQNPRKHIFPPLPFLLAEKEKESAVITHSKLTKKNGFERIRPAFTSGKWEYLWIFQHYSDRRVQFPTGWQRREWSSDNRRTNVKPANVKSLYYAICTKINTTSSPVRN